MATTVATVDDRAEFQSGLRAFLASRSPLTVVRETMATPLGYEPELYAELATQLGVCGLHVPEEHGGSGLGVAELAVVFEELGRALACAPLLGTVALAATALSGDARADGIAAGDTLAAFAEIPDALLDGGRLTGSARFVADAESATLLVVATADGVYAVDAADVTRTPMRTIDPTRRFAQVDLAAAPAVRVGDGSQGQRALDVGRIALAAELLGGAERALELAVSYAKDRVQFGRPIGSFQAIKHKCADIHVGVESARSAVLHAAAVADTRDAGELAVAASLAKAWSGEAALRATAECIQIHGGVGFTWEHDAHLYFKRATCSRQLLGDPASHRERIAAELGW